MMTMRVPPARPESWDEVLHAAFGGDRLLLFTRDDETELLLQPRGHRAIGVIYHPEREHLGNYVPTVLPRRYDALLYLDVTSALHPLPVPPQPEEAIPDTFPTGV